MKRQWRIQKDIKRQKSTWKDVSRKEERGLDKRRRGPNSRRRERKGEERRPKKERAWKGERSGNEIRKGHKKICKGRKGCGAVQQSKTCQSSDHHLKDTHTHTHSPNIRRHQLRVSGSCLEPLPNTCSTLTELLVGLSHSLSEAVQVQEKITVVFINPAILHDLHWMWTPVQPRKASLVPPHHYWCFLPCYMQWWTHSQSVGARILAGLQGIRHLFHSTPRQSIYSFM